ncbi:MAG: Hsp70 family protein, partial [Acidimicrobiia bacterium]|nr:Hsp70 family protein [Acidimicrobiia bacterium]
EAAEARNAADHAAHTVGKQLAEHGDKLDESEKAPIQEKLDALHALLKDEQATADSLKQGTQDLLQSAQTIGEKLYAASQEAEGSTQGSPDGTDEVVEAEVVEDDEA